MYPHFHFSFIKKDCSCTLRDLSRHNHNLQWSSHKTQVFWLLSTYLLSVFSRPHREIKHWVEDLFIFHIYIPVFIVQNYQKSLWYKWRSYNWIFSRLKIKTIGVFSDNISRDITVEVSFFIISLFVHF